MRDHDGRRPIDTLLQHEDGLCLLAPILRREREAQDGPVFVQFWQKKNRGNSFGHVR